MTAHTLAAVRLNMVRPTSCFACRTRPHTGGNTRSKAIWQLLAPYYVAALLKRCLQQKHQRVAAQPSLAAQQADRQSLRVQGMNCFAQCFLSSEPLPPCKS